MPCNSVTSDDILIKQPGETRQFSMNFANLMSEDEEITSVTDIQSSPTGLTITDGAIGADNQSVTLWIAGGTHLKTYRIEITVETDGGQTLEGDGKLKVLDT